MALHLHEADYPGAATNLICAFAHRMFMFPANAKQQNSQLRHSSDVDVKFVLLRYEIAFQLPNSMHMSTNYS